MPVKRVRSHRNRWVKFDKYCRAFKLKKMEILGDGSALGVVAEGSAAAD